MSTNSFLVAARSETWAIDQRWLVRAVAWSTQATDEKHWGGPGRQFRMPKVSGSVAILPMHGVISQRSSFWSELFGGTSTQSLGASFAAAVASPKISGIVLDVDSPGGTTAGVQELGDLIHEGAQRKPVVAVANSQAASAAYWLASQAGPRRFVAAPGGEVGSIGVFRMHEDISQMLAADGVKVTFLAMPQFKTEGNPFEPLTEAAATHHLDQVRQTYEAFVDAVARGRNVSPSKVRTAFGEGRAFHSGQAADMGMIDRVATLSQVLAEMGASAVVSPQQMAIDAELQSDLCEAWLGGMPEQLGKAPSPDDGHIAREIRAKRLAIIAK